MIALFSIPVNVFQNLRKVEDASESKSAFYEFAKNVAGVFGVTADEFIQSYEEEKIGKAKQEAAAALSKLPEPPRTIRKILSELARVEKDYAVKAAIVIDSGGNVTSMVSTAGGAEGRSPAVMPAAPTSTVMAPPVMAPTVMAPTVAPQQSTATAEEPKRKRNGVSPKSRISSWKALEMGRAAGDEIQVERLGRRLYRDAKGNEFTNLTQFIRENYPASRAAKVLKRYGQLK